jgi:nicotinamide mononucleotide transporter PnuC
VTNPFALFTKKDYGIWIFSSALVVLSNVLFSDVDFLVLAASLIGVTSLLFGAKGSVFGQILMIVFSLLYGVISFEAHYYGEMITYLGMTLPMAVWSTVTWILHTDRSGVVQSRRLKPLHWLVLFLATAVVTFLFYWILWYFQTPNLIWSTVSIATSFLAASLTMMRSPYFALWYGVNDIVLILLWTLDALQNKGSIPVIVIFCIFLFHDSYAFTEWKRRERSSS